MRPEGRKKKPTSSHSREPLLVPARHKQRLSTPLRGAESRLPAEALPRKDQDRRASEPEDPHLNAFFKKGRPVKLSPLGDVELTTYRAQLDRVKSPPIPLLPKPGRPYSLGTDARAKMVGVAAFQTDESGQRHPIGFCSRSLLLAEKNFSKFGGRVSRCGLGSADLATIPPRFPLHRPYGSRIPPVAARNS